MTRVVILLSTTEHSGPVKGVYGIFKYLPSDSYSITVASLSTDPQDNMRLDFEAAGCRCISLGLDGIRRWLVGKAVARLIAAEKPDVLYCTGIRPDIFGGRAGCRLDVAARITTVRNIPPEDYRFKYGPLASRVAWWRHRRALKRYFHHVVAHATRMAEFLRADGIPHDTVKVILNGVDLSALRPASRETRARARRTYVGGFDGPVIAYVGHLTGGKGIYSLLDAASRLRSWNADVRYLLVGDGKDSEGLKRLAEANGLKRQFVFIGRVADVAAPLAAADVFVLPSLSEGLSRALLEAMAMGLPPVATDVSGTRDVIPDESYGLVVPPGDPVALADALGKLVTDPDLRREMGRRARGRVVEHFSAERMALDYHELFQELLAAAR